MKAAMIFARKTTWRSRLDLEYLDETSNRKLLVVVKATLQALGLFESKSV